MFTNGSGYSTLLEEHGSKPRAIVFDPLNKYVTVNKVKIQS